MSSFLHLKNGSEHFELTYLGELAAHLGVDIKRGQDSQGSFFELIQHHLIQCIIKHVGIDAKMTNSQAAPVGKPLLHKDFEGEHRKHDWNCQSIVGMLTHLTNSTRPECAMAAHQCARFNNQPVLSHK